MALVLAGAVCFASGLLLVCVGWSRMGALASDLLLRASLGAGYGLGVFSVVFFLARVCRVTHLVAVDLAAIGFLIVVVVLASRSSRALPGLTGFPRPRS